MEAGKDDGLIPCGLAARDTLRLEAGMPLYGHEMDDGVSPFETNLGFAVKMTKDDFIGKSALISRGAPEITRVGLKVTGRGIARERCPVFLGEDKIGETTSGTYLPYLKGAYAMALIRRTGAIPGNQVTIGIPKTHEWVEYITENTARIGLTDFAREALGSLVFVNLPQEGDSLSTGEGFGEVDRYDLDYSAVPFHS
jgi:glycine cleavage system aminomethyltransferase T